MKPTIYLFAALLILLSGCEETARYDGPRPDPQLVLFSFVRPDSAMTIQVGRTHFLDEEYTLLEGATGEVYINDRAAGELVHVKDDKYTSPAIAQAGDRVRIEVRADGFPDASGEVEMLTSGVNMQVDTVSERTVGGSTLGKLHFQITLKDAGKGREYYRLIIATSYREEGEKTKWSYRFDIENDPLLTIGNQGYFSYEEENIYRIFTNEMYEGGSYTLRVSRDLEYSYEYETTDKKGVVTTHRVTVTNVVQVVRIDEATYRYLKSEILARREEDLVEPVQVYSNIRNGVGIVGTEFYTSQEIVMPVVKIPEQPLYTE